jgi:hypothetical protein
MISYFALNFVFGVGLYKHFKIGAGAGAAFVPLYEAGVETPTMTIMKKLAPVLRKLP